MFLSTIQKLLLAVAIFEMPLGIDTYLFHQPEADDVGALVGFNVSLLSICVLGLYVTWVFELATHRACRHRKHTCCAVALIYLMAVAISALVAENVLYTFFELVLLGQTYLLFLFLVQRVIERQDLMFLMTIVAVAVLFQSVIVAGSTYVLPSLGVETLDLKLLTITIGEDGRPGGTMISPNIVGSYLATLLLPVSSLILISRSQLVKFLANVGVIFGGLATVLTQSRGAIVAVLVACLVFGIPMFVRGWLPKWFPALAAGVALVVAIPLYQMLQQRVLGDDENAAMSRVPLAQVASQIISDHPVLGVGAGNYHLVAGKYSSKSPFRSEWFQTVHSKYLLVLAETGLIGLSAFLVFIICCIGRGWSAWNMNDRSMSPLTLALVAGVVGHLVHFNLDRFNDRPSVQTLWLALALLVCSAQACVAGRPADHQL